MATRTGSHTGEDDAAIHKEFGEAVNMTASAIEAWLKTDESRGVGMTREGEHEAVGHKEGRHVVAILRKPKGALTADDYAHMRKVVGYIRRHMAQGGPAEDVEHSRWRYSLMNWGHDPGKK